MPAERGAKRACRRLGVVGVADRAHDDDPLAPRRRRPRRRWPASIPPIANQGGVAGAVGARRRRSSSPAAGRPAFVGVSQTGPTLIWSGRGRSPAAASAASNCAGRVGREADERAGPGERAGLGDRRVVLADVDAVGAAGLDQVGPVVEEEERAVLGGGAAEGSARASSSSAQRGAFSRSWIMSTPPASAASSSSSGAGRWGGLADEVQAGGAKRLPPASPGRRRSPGGGPPRRRPPSKAPQPAAAGGHVDAAGAPSPKTSVLITSEVGPRRSHLQGLPAPPFPRSSQNSAVTARPGAAASDPAKRAAQGPRLRCVEVVGWYQRSDAVDSPSDSRLRHSR